MIFKFVTADRYRKQVCYMSVCWDRWNTNYQQQLNITSRALIKAGYIPQNAQPIQLQLEAMDDYGSGKYWYKVCLSIKKKWVRIGTLRELGKFAK